MIKRGLAPIAVATALVAAGCGSNNNSSSSADSSQSDASPGTTAAKPSSGTAKPSSGAIDVKLSEWAITPSSATAKAGKVTFDVTNAGKLPHEMVVLKTDKDAAALGKGAKVPEPGNQGEVEDLDAGGSKKLTLNLKKGHYVLICNLPGHYSAGMSTNLTVS